ncbi:hypothetical protein HDF16_006013 [Granulicella aggregans]|uniref:Uncharacterized protein n=1 Tax=Granulicella aggregans TaxID=474949 RepID=A0A7W8E725_9BACT|nr:hypothetical protein [Granulicella aggregans]
MRCRLSSPARVPRLIFYRDDVTLDSFHCSLIVAFTMLRTIYLYAPLLLTSLTSCCLSETSPDKCSFGQFSPEQQLHACCLYATRKHGSFSPLLSNLITGTSSWCAGVAGLLSRVIMLFLIRNNSGRVTPMETPAPASSASLTLYRAPRGSQAASDLGKPHVFFCLPALESYRTYFRRHLLPHK